MLTTYIPESNPNPNYREYENIWRTFLASETKDAGVGDAFKSARGQIKTVREKNVFRSGYLVSWRWLTRPYLRKSICWAWAWWRAISARHVDGVTPAAASHGGSGWSSGKHQLAAEEDKIRRGITERERGSGALVTYEMLREAAAFLFSKFSTTPSPLQNFKLFILVDRKPFLEDILAEKLTKIVIKLKKLLQDYNYGLRNGAIKVKIT